MVRVSLSLTVNILQLDIFCAEFPLLPYIWSSQIRQELPFYVYMFLRLLCIIVLIGCHNDLEYEMGINDFANLLHFGPPNDDQRLPSFVNDL